MAFKTYLCAHLLQVQVYKRILQINVVKRRLLWRHDDYEKHEEIGLQRKMEIPSCTVTTKKPRITLISLMNKLAANSQQLYFLIILVTFPFLPR